MEVSKENLQILIEPFLRSHLVNDTYLIKTVSPHALLVSDRFDLAFKLTYLDLKWRNLELAEKVYDEHIRAFGLGKYKEPGNENKSNLQTFLDDFDDTFKSISSNGFDKSKTIIPISPSGSIANGAHRVAAAIFLNKNVTCVNLTINDHIYDYKFFYSRNVNQELLDLAATKFVEYAENVYVAFVWPTAVGHDAELEKIIPNIVYRKDVNLSANGAHNLLSQIYFGEPWLGTVENNFNGVKYKLVECFKTFGPVRVIAFQAKNLEDVLEIKERVRGLFNVGKHSIHITDTKEEAVRVARAIFNDNSIHFLNYAQPNKYHSTHAKLEKFNSVLAQNNINNEDVVIDGGIVLSLYGLREASDIDYLASDKITIESNDEELECHDKELEYHDEEKADLIYNSKFYFYFNNIKFISFNQLHRMKKNRAEQKDVNDYKLMESMIENDHLKKIKFKTKQMFLYGKVKARAKAIRFLKFFGLFNVVRQVYKGIKR